MGFATFGNKMKALIPICFLNILFIALVSAMTAATAQAASDDTVVTEAQTTGRGSLKVRRRRFNPFSTRRISRYSNGRWGLPTRSSRSVAPSSTNGLSLASSFALSSSQSSTPILIAPLAGGVSVPTVSSARTPYAPPVRSPYRPPPRPSF